MEWTFLTSSLEPTTNSNFWAPTPNADDMMDVGPLVASLSVPEAESPTLTSKMDNPIDLYGILDSLLDEFP